MLLQVADDGMLEGAEDVLISQSFVNGCGDTALSSVRLVILDAIPMNANAMDLACEGSDTTQSVGFEDITGFGPLSYAWGGDGFANGESGVLEGTSVLQSEFSMVDVDGQTLANALVSLTLTDQCGNLTTFEQNVRAVVVPAGWCVDSTYAQPFVNWDIPILDLTIDGMSILGSGLLQDTLTVHATQVNELWVLDSLTTGSVDWSGMVTLVDSCGRMSSAEWYVLEYACTAGCTDNSACNFNVDAGIEDGSCTFTGDECEGEGESLAGWVLNEVCDCVPMTDVVDAMELTFDVFPNPNVGDFRVVANVDDGLLRIRAADGRLVHEVHPRQLQGGVRVNLNLSNGMYLIELMAGGFQNARRIVVQR